MEWNRQSTPQFEPLTDVDDSKYLCKLSTILVANLQEVKDRISHIEFIFCNQLFPNFQTRSDLLEKRLVEARRTSEDEQRKGEGVLLRQIEELRLENQQAQEQIHQLRKSERVLSCQIEELHLDNQQAQEQMQQQGKSERVLLPQIEELHLENQQAHEQIQQLNLSLKQNNTRLMNTQKQLSECEHENKELKVKLEAQSRNEEIIGELNEQLSQRSSELSEGRETRERLSQQLQMKDDELLVERSKRRALLEEDSRKYKELKSQYNFLLKKMCHTLDNKPRLEMIEPVKASTVQILRKRSPQDNIDEEFNHLTSRLREPKTESEDANPHINLSSDTTSLNEKPVALDARSKSSCWRGTRVHGRQTGADPHDDFLNTPMEAAKNLYMVTREEAQDFPAPAPGDMDFSTSDEGLLEAPAGSDPQQQVSVPPHPVSKGFKYVEPTRKKAARESLKGVECKQCKKFYDAVLPDGNRGKMDGFDNPGCEHHDGVSRHRYRYAPPSTPEGFWNIGFESEM